MLAPNYCPVPEHSKNGLFICSATFISERDLREGYNAPVLTNFLDTLHLNLGAIEHLESVNKQWGAKAKRHNDDNGYENNRLFQNQLVSFHLITLIYKKL